jgi:hypothetical protein
MHAWKKLMVVCSVLLVNGMALQAEEVKKEKHMVDMADQLNTQEFYDSKNPDALWSSELKMPWAKSSAINAYEDGKQSNDVKSSDKKPSTATETQAATAAIKEENIAKPVTGEVNGKKVDAEQLVNIRVLYTLETEKSRAAFSPVSAQNELFRQMSKYCSNGFQKIAEWSEPEGSDYYLYYQFKCMEKR